jgi:hypothetical protein
MIRAGLALLLLATVAPHSTQANSGRDGDAGQEWRFRVLLDDREIGTHRYAVTGIEGERQVEIDARFSVRLVFVEAYRYVHEARESWRGDCLDGIDARTDDNGRELSVRGRRDGAILAVATDGGRTALPGCVMSFAYWNPAILQQSRLLNSQTGEHESVRVEPLGEESLRIRDRTLTTRRYALHTDGFRVDLWYSPDDRWVQLESRTSGGRRLRYVLQ